MICVSGHMESRATGKNGERLAVQYLLENKFNIIDVPTNPLSPYDILARKGENMYAINVKTTIKHNFVVQPANISRLLNFCSETNSILSYLFVCNGSYVLVALDKALLHWDIPESIKNARKTSIVTSFTTNPPIIRAIVGEDCSIPIPDAVWEAECRDRRYLQINITRIDDEDIIQTERAKIFPLSLLIKTGHTSIRLKNAQNCNRCCAADCDKGTYECRLGYPVDIIKGIPKEPCPKPITIQKLKTAPRYRKSP